MDIPPLSWGFASEAIRSPAAFRTTKDPWPKSDRDDDPPLDRIRV